MKQFVNEEYDIHNDSQKLYMEYLIENNKAEFITHYSKYQFVLNLDIREEFQSKIQDDEQLMKILMIRNNIIPDRSESIRSILIKILMDINDFDFNADNVDSDLKKIFIDNHIYFNSPFSYFLSTKYIDNLEYKYNKLFAIVHFFFPWEISLKLKI